MTNHEIASAYVRYYLEGADADFWAVEKLDEMAGDNPENAWSIIRRINSIHIEDRVWREHVYGVLGCGALETLIVVHRDTMLPQILDAAKTDPVLRMELSVIYETSIGSASWRKIRAVLND